MLGGADFVVGTLLEDDVLDVVEGCAPGEVALCDVVRVVPVPELSDVFYRDILRALFALQFDAAHPLLGDGLIVAGRRGVHFVREIVF